MVSIADLTKAHFRLDGCSAQWQRRTFGHGVCCQGCVGRPSRVRQMLPPGGFQDFKSESKHEVAEAASFKYVLLHQGNSFSVGHKSQGCPVDRHVVEALNGPPAGQRSGPEFGLVVWEFENWFWETAQPHLQTINTHHQFEGSWVGRASGHCPRSRRRTPSVCASAPRMSPGRVLGRAGGEGP